MLGRPSPTSSRRNGKKQAAPSISKWPTHYRPIIEQLEDRLTPATVDLGIGLGTHLSGQTSATQFAFELLRPDSIDITIAGFDSATGDLGLKVFRVPAGVAAPGGPGVPVDPAPADPIGIQIADCVTGLNDEVASLVNLPVGRYRVEVTGPVSSLYTLAIEPGATSSTRLFYVNDGSTAGDRYATAPGDDANAGNTPSAPKASVQSLLAANDLDPTDVVVLDTGTYSGGVALGASDEGILFAGSPGGSTFTVGAGQAHFTLTDSDFNTFYNLNFSGGAYGIRATGSGSGADTETTDTRVDRNVFTGVGTAVEFTGGTNNAVLGNTISGGATGISLANGGGAVIRANRISVTGDGVAVAVATDVADSSVTVEQNTITAGGTGVAFSNVPTYFTNAYTATVSGNAVSGAAVGVSVGTATGATVIGNQIDANPGQSVASASAIGIQSASATARIAGNTILRARTGITGFGTFGGDSWAAGQPNVISVSDVGIAAGVGAEVRFNRVSGAATAGITAADGTFLHHNVVFDNPGDGIRISGANVRVENNTVYAPSTDPGSDGIWIGGSSGVRLRNNIIWVQGGYALSVDTDSQQGFDSDYNNLYTTGAGKVVRWQKAFTDLFDWQVEGLYDTHSIGTTGLAPALDNPRFLDPDNADPALADFRLSTAPGSFSTSIDAGDPTFRYDSEPGSNGGRIDLGAYGNTALAGPSKAEYVAIDYPNYYTDWSANEARAVLWHTFNVSGQVALDLYRVTPGAGVNGPVGFVTRIAVVQAADGSFAWSPAASGITPDTAARYRIRISSLADATVLTDSREPFSVPATTGQYFLDDASNTNDEYTPTGTGSNRNTGATASDPKRSPTALFQSYNLGPADVVNFDTGTYDVVRNLTLSGNRELTGNDDEGATLRGPTDPTNVATIDRGNKLAGTAVIEVRDGDFIKIQNLTLRGGYQGLWVHDSSTYFAGYDLTVTDNATYGLRIDAGSEGTDVDRLKAFANGGTGISIATPIARLTGSTASNNGATGIELLDTGATRVWSTEVYGNAVGIAVGNSSSGVSQTTQIGDADLSTGHGNRIHDNTGTGVSATGNVLVAGNTVANNRPASGTGGVGIALVGATAQGNIVTGSSEGITTDVLAAGTVIENRVYGNAVVGIHAYGSSPVQRNVVYGNGVGVLGDDELLYGYYPYAYSGTISNNLIYGNGQQGILIKGGSGAQLLNNTVYQTAADAVRIQSELVTSTNIRLRNNVLVVNGTGPTGLYALNVATDSQQGFDSDYNLFWAPRQTTDAVSLWQGVSGKDQKAWYYTAYQDANGLFADPQFVDPTNGDFHLKSQYGVRAGGSLAPVLGGAGLPVANLGTLATSANTSPAIDAGDPTSAFAAEPTPNGGVVNLGFEGNTAQASTSPATFVRVIGPNGGETLLPGRQTTIRWRSEAAGTFNIELLSAGIPVLTLASGLSTTGGGGSFTWTVPTTLTAGAGYTIRVTRTTTGDVDISDAAFAIAPSAAAYTFYVEPSADPANTDVANDGLTLTRPKASIRAVLEAYDLALGDVILVGGGAYTLTSGIRITAADSGATIQARDPANRPSIDRQVAQYPVFDLVGADQITIDGLALTGGSAGVNATLDSDDLVVRRSVFTGMSTAISVDSTGDNARVLDNTVTTPTPTGYSYSYTGVIDLAGGAARATGNQVTFGSGYGIRVSAANAVVVGNTIRFVSPAGSYNSGYGVYVSGDGTVVSGNMISLSGSGYGITAYIYSYGGGTPSPVVIGTSSEGGGNTVTGGSTGVSSYGLAQILGNTVTGVSSTGISAYNGATIDGNTVLDAGYYGISTSSPGAANTITNNHVSGATTSGTGIYVYDADVVRGNRVHNTGTGIAGYSNYYGNSYFTGTIENNLVYLTSTAGIIVDRPASPARIANNTVYQTSGGDGIRVTGAGTGLTITNNVLSLGGTGYSTTYALSVNPESQQGVHSDYNVVQVAGNARFGLWQNTALADHAAWYYGTGQDKNSRVGDPLFVDPDGADGILGSGAVPIGSPVIIDDGDAGFAVTGTWQTSTAAGRDGSFLRKDTGTGASKATWTFSGLTPGTYEVAASWPSYTYEYNGSYYDYYNYNYYTTFTVKDAVGTLASKTTYGFSPDFTADGTSWARLGTVTITGNSLTVELPDQVQYDYGYKIAADAVRLQRVQPTSGADDDFRLGAGSPGIDAGDPASAYADEPAPNGGRVNAGADGNTARAAASPAQLVQVLGPTRFDKPTQGQSTTIPWRSAGLGASTYRVELSTDGGTTWSTLATGQAVDANGNGFYAWTPTAATPSGRLAQVRVTAEDGSGTAATSALFQIARPGNQFYVSPTGNDELNDGKSEDRPMKTLAALLDIYSLGSGDVIHLAAGTHNELRNAVFTSQHNGVKITGPGTLARGNTNPFAAGLDLVGADDVVIDGIGVSGGAFGVRADAASDRLTITNGTFTANGTGAQVAGGSAILTGNTATSNTTGFASSGPNAVIGSNLADGNGTGISSSGTDAAIASNQVRRNTSVGIAVSGARSRVLGNGVRSNGTGIQESGPSGADRVVIGGPGAADGNAVAFNQTGISGSQGLVQSNILTSNTGTGINGGGEVTGNTVSGGTNGIVGSQLVTDNRVYNNTDAGIETGYGATVRGNTVYDNSTGVRITQPSYGAFTGLVTNNLVYDNSNTALSVDQAAAGARIAQNTIYQPAGDGVRVTRSAGLQIRNNIIRVDAGYALNVAADSQDGFDSDYNLFDLTGTGKLALWQGVGLSDRADWFYEVGQDRHSRVGDPMFVSPAGADGYLGYSTQPAGAPLVVDNGDAGFAQTGSWSAVTGSGGYGDDYQTASDGYYTPATATATWTFAVTPGEYQIALTWPAGSYRSDTPLEVYDGTTLLKTFNLNQSTAPNDFADGGSQWERLTTMTITSGTLVIRMSNGGTYYTTIAADAVRVQRIVGNSSAADDDFRLGAGSPGIDAGDPASAYADEPAPNGGRVNAGADGNTARAAASPAQLVQVLAPNGLEKFEQGQSVTVTWRSAGLGAATYRVELSTDGGTTWGTLATGLPVDANGNGAFAFTAPAPTTGNTALVRVTAEGGSGTSDTSDDRFLFANNGADYYLSPTGNNRNDGKSPDRPMKSLAALLDAYNLDPGDVIRVAPGQYSLLRNVVFGADDSAVRVEASAGSGRPVLDRGNTNSFATAIQFAGADDVTLSGLEVVGGYRGVVGGGDSDRVTLTGLVVRDNATDGVAFDATTDSVAVRDGQVYDNGSGVRLAGPDATVSNNLVHDNGTGITLTGARGLVSANQVYENQSGISVTGYSEADQPTVRDNTVRDNGGVGILSSGPALIAGNTVLRSGGDGIQLSGGKASGNVVSGSEGDGIEARGAALVSQNRVYANRDAGVHAYDSATVQANTVFGNATGVVGDYYYPSYYPVPYTGLIVNNFITGNSDTGIRISMGATGAQLVNNTVYTQVGEAIRIDTASSGMKLRNNIVRVESGIDLYVAEDSGLEFNSDYNLFETPTGSSLGYWNTGGQPALDGLRATLATWRTVSGQDAHSIQGPARFVDLDGADGVVGYIPEGLGYDATRDDNPYLRVDSPAIDAGDPAGAPTTDLEGRLRTGGPDIGAYEFAGSLSDGTPPTITATTPTAIGLSGTTYAQFKQIVLTASEELNPIDPPSAALYRLSGAGVDGVLGTADDVLYSITPRHTPGTNTVTLDVNIAAAGLPPDRYEFRVYNGTVRGLHDLAGLALDGDGNGTEGGDYVRTFTVLPVVAVTAPAGGLLTTEAAGTATFEVVLAVAPAAGTTVTIPLSVPADPVTGQPKATLSTAALVFTSANWSVPQTVTVTGANDFIDDGNADDRVAYTVVLGPATSADPAFSGVDPTDVAGANQDDDTAGVTVVTAPNLLTTEAGGTATFTVRLNSQPVAAVAINLISSNPNEGSATVGQLTFTAANWNVPQTVTVAGAPDAIDDGDVGYQIVPGRPTSTDPKYAALAAPAPVALTNRDDGDTAGVTVVAAPNLLTTEAGGTATFTVRLNSQPRSDVVLSLVSDDPTEGGNVPVRLYFRADNWNVPQTVTARGVDDDLVDGNVTYHILLGPTTSFDPKYNGLAVPPVTLINIDDELVNRPPQIEPQTYTVAENSAAGTAVGTVPATDPDVGQTLTYAITAGNGSGAFAIDPASGRITVASATALDFETTPTFALTVRVSDSSIPSASAAATVTINLSDVNERPVLVAIGNKAVDEGSALTFTATATDPDRPANALTFSLAGAPGGASIDPVTGSFTWIPTDGPTNTATFKVRVTDNGSPVLFAEETITVTVRNVAPTVALPAPSPILAGQPITASGSFTDPAGAADDGYTYRWRVLHGGTTAYDSGAVATTSAAGVPNLVYAPPDAGAYTVELTVTDKDGGTNTVTRTATVSPSVTGIGRLDAATTNATSVRFRVSFSDPVAGLGATNFAVPATGGITGAGVTGVMDDGDGRTWTVTVSTGTGDGSVGLNLANTTGLTGPDGVAVLAQTLTGPAYTVDKTAPAVVNFYVVYGNGLRYDLATATRLNLPWAIAAVQVVFSEAVTGTTTSLGLAGRYGALGVSGVSGSGTDTLTWTLAAPITLDRVTATLTAGGIRDAGGNAVAPAHTSFGFAVVLGDVSGDGRVATNDRTLMRQFLSSQLTNPGAYNSFYDLDGDGDVDPDDLRILEGRIGTGVV